MTDVVNEGTKAWLTASFYDKNDALAAPSSATYRIDCLTTGTAVRAFTALSVSSQIEIPLTSADNAIISNVNGQELRRVTIIGVYGASDEIKDQYDYYVKNLSGI